MEKYLRQFENCIQQEVSYCVSECPFHLDVLDFTDKMERAQYNRAYNIFRKAVGFPDIVASICEKYCESVCPLKDSVDINAMEKACVKYATRKDATSYNLPKKKERVAVIGGGISGLACALRLANKKYDVLVFERGDKLGGKLLDFPDRDIYLEDIERQLACEKENLEIELNTTVEDLSELRGFDCVYIATGKGGNSFGENKRIEKISDLAVWRGGCLLGKDIIRSVADGFEVAKAIEAYTKTGRQEEPLKYRETEVIIDEINLEVAKVVPAGEIYSDEEVKEEAARCIRCKCDFCIRFCDLANYLDKWPLEMRDDIVTTVMSSESMIHKTPAIRLMNSCTHCGICTDVCPPHIDLDNMIAEAKFLLHKNGKMPPAFHGFWLDDMRYANSEISKICSLAPGKDKAEYAFFPGCHLGAANPEYVKSTYGWLLDKYPGMGLLLRCCGVPADWAGNEEMSKQEVSSLISDWKDLGSPILVTACSSCQKYIGRIAPEIEIVSLYELMAENPEELIRGEQGEFFLFNPCAARGNEDVKEAVRKILDCGNIGYDEVFDEYGCCGFGGNIEVANPGLRADIIDKRKSLSEKAYITYCINCRDAFLQADKPAVHILDLIFQIETKLPSLSKRRENRAELKETLAREVWGEEVNITRDDYPFEVKFSREVEAKMEELKLVDTDIKEVIYNTNRLHRRTYEPKEKTYTCYFELNFLTVWVTYKIKDEVYEIKNLYAHRMKIELEGVWNGKKQ